MITRMVAELVVLRQCSFLVLTYLVEYYFRLADHGPVSDLYDV